METPLLFDFWEYIIEKTKGKHNLNENYLKLTTQQ